MISFPLFRMFKKTTPFLLIVGFIFTSCGDEKSKKKSTSSNKIVLKQSFKDKLSYKNTDDYKLLENSCLYCHKIGASADNEIAPTMKTVRDVYKLNYSSKQDFVDAFVKFTTKPSEDNAILQAAVKRYGLMEDCGLTKEDVEDIASYLYDFKF